MRGLLWVNHWRKMRRAPTPSRSRSTLRSGPDRRAHTHST